MSSGIILITTATCPKGTTEKDLRALPAARGAGIRQAYFAAVLAAGHLRSALGAGELGIVSRLLAAGYAVLEHNFSP
jgi:hypothetical protein